MELGGREPGSRLIYDQCFVAVTGENMNLDDFVVAVRRIPHISEAVVAQLGARDIANCLRTNKSVRSFVIQGSLKLTPDARERLNLEACRCVVIHGRWSSNQVEFPFHEMLSPFRLAQCLGLNSWVCVSGGADGAIAYNTRNSMYELLYTADLHGGLSDDRSAISVLSPDNVLLFDAEEAHAASLRDIGRVDHVVRVTHSWEEDSHHLRVLPRARALRENCPDVFFTFDFRDLQGLKSVHGISFPDDLGDLTSDCVCRLGMETAPIKLAKQGHLALMVWESLLKLYNAESGAELWRTAITKEPYKKLPAFVTDTMCGYVYQVAVERTADRAVDEYRVVIFDSKDGTLVGDHHCWQSAIHHESVSRYKPGQPHVMAQGRHLCAMTNAWYDAEKSPSQVRGWAFFCAEVVRSSNGKLGAKTRVVHVDVSDTPCALPILAIPERPSSLGRAETDETDPRLIGIAFDGVAVGVYENRRDKNPGAVAAIFTLDVNRAVEDNRKLSDVYRKYPSCEIPPGGSVSFWPHYKATKPRSASVDLMGLLEVRHFADDSRSMISHLFHQDVELKMEELSTDGKRQAQENCDDSNVDEKRKRKA